MSEQRDNAPEVKHSTPVFNGGTFVIDFLSTSSSGFSVRTDRTLRMRENLQVATPLLTSEQTKSAKESMQKEVARAMQRAGIEENKVHSVESPITQEQRNSYIATLTTNFRKYGVRNVRENVGDTLEVDIKAPYYGMYRVLGGEDPESFSHELANPTGNSVVLLTADNKLILQYRKPYDEVRKTGNFLYGGVPGASAAGIFDAQRGEPGTGKPKAIGTEDIKQHALKETTEEIGLQPENITSISIMGFARNLVKTQSEFLMFAKTNLAYDELKKFRRSSSQNEFDFGEKFLAIEGTPDAIGKLLTELSCPLPPTHAAAFLAAGYAMVLENGLQKGLSHEQAINEANAWKEKLQQGVQDNYHRINKRVADYWKEYSQEVMRHSPNRPLHDIAGYDPAYSPEEQGLPSLEKELARVGLV